MATKPVPTKATIFAYQVGFGDCFLLRFDYDRGQPRHVLIDFGTTGLPENFASKWMYTVAKDIEAKCGGRLDGVVATHRHADHISGFATKADGKGSGDVIAALKPRVVVQPWTEEPDLETDATAPAGKKFYGASLRKMNEIAAAAVEQVRANGAAFAAHSAQLKFIGEDNIANRSAIDNLQTMGGKQVYTYHGRPSGLDPVLPGIKVHVLGPPTLEQTDAIRKQRAKDPDEFWQLQLRRLTDDADLVDNPARLFPGHPWVRGSKLPRDVRWLAGRVRNSRGEQLLQLVRMLDKQMNNTSLILLFEAGSKKLLFPGDAQLENWQYALSKDWVTELLRDVDVYKVGHHGSLNATPRSMWKTFTKRGRPGEGRLTTVLSTMEGKHGTAEAHTEVPRRSLLKVLRSESDLRSTHELDPATRYQEIQIDLR